MLKPNLIQSVEDESVATLLELRIIFFAPYLDLCLDTNCMFDENFKDSVAKMLCGLRWTKVNLAMSVLLKSWKSRYTI